MGVSLSPQVLFLDIQAQRGVLFPYLPGPRDRHRGAGHQRQRIVPSRSFTQHSFTKSDVLFLQTAQEFRPRGLLWG